MDARERLRQFLEQRRELGEREFVLDGMEVDEALRILGVVGKQGDAARAADREASRDMTAAARRPPAPAPDAPPDRADAPPPAERERPERPELPGAATGDWRETLRAAGGAPADQLRRPGAGGTPAAQHPADPTEAEAEMARRKTASKPAEDDVPPAAPAKTPAKRAAAAPAMGGGTLPKWLAGIDAPAGLVVGQGTTELFEGAIAKLRTLEDIAEAVEKCTRCPLYKTATHGVPGEGNPDAGFFCVGEAPGANEDASGRPFVGQAGQLLTKILAAINLTREEVFIANVLKHRPPGNRNPAPNEVEACSPYLLRQLELVKPKVIVAFGTFAAQTLLETKTPIGKLREHVHLYHGIPLVVTYHPAALLRNPAWKRPTWHDVQLARRILDLAPGA